MELAIWGAIALVLGLLLARHFVARKKPVLSIDVALRDPAKRGEALRMLDARLARAVAADDPAPGLQNVASYASVLLDAGDARGAADLLRKIPLDKMPDAPRAIAANTQAIAHLELDEIGEARRALERAGKRPGGDVGAVIASTDALVTALQGDYDTALELCDEAASHETAVDVGSPLAEARATALAGLGRLDEARAVLEKHLADAPDAVTLDMIVQRGGPAAPVAEAIVAAHSVG